MLIGIQIFRIPIVQHGFSNCDQPTTTVKSATVHWYAALTKIEIEGSFIYPCAEYPVYGLSAHYRKLLMTNDECGK